MAHQVGQILSADEARKINAEFVDAKENDKYYYDKRIDTLKKGQLVLLNKANYGKKPVYAVVKVTMAKYPASDEYGLIRVGDNEYTWRVEQSSFCVIPR